MIMVPRESPLVPQRQNQEASRLDLLKVKIHNEAYLNEAIQRIAQVMSNEILDIPQERMFHEQRKGRK